eukprot:9995823-Alexandrium_andersonii.AAC.1
MALRSSLRPNNRTRESGEVHFRGSRQHFGVCGVPDWVGFSKSVMGKIEASRSAQRARSGRPADQLPRC